MKILVVDDVPLVRKMIRGAVEALDGTVLEASNGVEALKVLKLNADNIELILLDWNMPEMDGMEFLAKVKGSKYKDIPVIMTTQENQREKIIQAIQAGASQYLVKPFTAEELIKKIIKFTGGSDPPLERCFSVAFRDLLGSAAGEAVSDLGADPAEATANKPYYCGQIFIPGKRNAVVFITMNEETAAGTAARQTGKLPSQLGRDEVVECLAGFLRSASAKARALSGTLSGASTPFIMAGFASEFQPFTGDGGVHVVAKKFRAGYFLMHLNVYYL